MRDDKMAHNNSAHDGIASVSELTPETCSAMGKTLEAQVLDVIKRLNESQSFKEQALSEIRLKHAVKDAYLRIDKTGNFKSDEDYKLNFELVKNTINPVGIKITDILEHMGAHSIGRPSTYAGVIEELVKTTFEQTEQGYKAEEIGLAKIDEINNELRVIPSAQAIRAFMTIKSKKPDWASNLFSMRLVSIMRAIEDERLTPYDALLQIRSLLSEDNDEFDNLNLTKLWNDVDEIYSEGE
jgi:reverse gyrase